MERLYLKVIKNGKADKVIDDFTLLHNEVSAEWHAFAQSFNTTELFASNRLLGLVFRDANHPTGWISPKKVISSVFRPKRAKVCLEDYNRFSALRSLPDSHKLAKMLGISPIFDESALHYPTFETIGENTIISVHPKSLYPVGSNLLKTSEYYKLKEEYADNVK